MSIDVGFLASMSGMIYKPMYVAGIEEKSCATTFSHRLEFFVVWLGTRNAVKGFVSLSFLKERTVSEVLLWDSFICARNRLLRISVFFFIAM